MAAPSMRGFARTACLVLALILFFTFVQAHPSNKARHEYRTPATVCDARDSSWDLTVANWVNASVDENLRTFRYGGIDTDGINYTGLQPGEDFSMELGRYFLGDWSCSFEDRCIAPTSCKVMIIPSRWAFFAMAALANINNDWCNLYTASTVASAGLAHLDLKIADTFGYDPPSHVTAFQRLLSAFGFFSSMLGTVASILAPEVAPELETAFAVGSKLAGGLSSTFGAINTQIGFHSSQIQPWANAEMFGDFVASAFQSLNAALNNTTNLLLGGQTIGNITILDVLQGGAWISRSNVTNEQLTDAMTRHILSIGINALWKESKTTDTKTWVTYANLSDSDGSICEADRSGPQEFKSCGDDGVYYLYRLEETTHIHGYLAKPWGIDNFTQFGLNPSWVANASAKTYRSSSNGFDFDPSASASEFFQKIENGEVIDIIAEAGSMAGDWTVPVCDVGPHIEWNQDYISHPNQNHGPLPCYCGPNGNRTAEFVGAAKMENFHTMPDWCKDQLKQPGAWPPGVSVIDLGWTKIHK